MRMLMLAGLACLLTADEAPKGVAARASASEYATQARWRNAILAASLIPSKQVEHLFAFDISKAYVVFEVACYVEGASDVRLLRSAFVVKTNASGQAIHNAEPGVVASAVLRQNLAEMPSSHNTNISTGATIGVEHGNDPYTGRPATHVYTAASVGVEQGGRGNTPPRDPKPGGTSEDRRMLEAQLEARSLPEGRVTHTVGGYIFFRKADVKTQADNTYLLQYLAEEESTGVTRAIQLALPRKAR